MNNERELFEEWICNQEFIHYGMGGRSIQEICLFDKDYQTYHFRTIQECWKAWQASAQREGFVSVNKEPNGKYSKAFWNDFLVEQPNAQTMHFSHGQRRSGEMTFMEISLALMSKLWCSSYKFNDIGGMVELSIKVTDVRESNIWCSNNLPPGFKYIIELDE